MRRRNFFKMGMLTLAATVLLPGCMTSRPSASQPKQKSVPVVETPQRVYETADTTGKTLVDFFEVPSSPKNPPLVLDRKTALLSAAFLIDELGLSQRLPADAKARFAELFFQTVPTGGDVKEIVLPLYADPANGEAAAYFFIAQTKDGSGAQAFKVQSNIPMASYFTPGVYDGYEVYQKGKLFAGVVPKAWVSTFYLYYSGNKVHYWGPTLPQVGSPLLVKGEDIRSDRTLSLTWASPDDVSKGIAALQDTLKAVTENLKGETDAAKIASLARLKKMANLSIALYSWIKGDDAAAAAARQDAKDVVLADPKVPRFDNPTRLSSVLDTVFELDPLVPRW